MKKFNIKVLIGSLITIGIGIGAYIVGLNINNPHIIAFSTEVGGAGIVGVILSLLK